MKKIFVIVTILLALTLTGCRSDDTSNASDVDISDGYNITKVREIESLVINANNVATINIKVGEAKNIMIKKLSTIAYNTGGQTISVSSSELTSESVASSVGTTLGTSIEGTVGVPGAASISTTVSLETSTSITAEHTKATTTGQSSSVSLDAYDKDLYYAIILIGSYDIYQQFTIDLETGEFVGTIYTKTIGEIATGIASTNDSDFTFELNMDGVMLSEFSMDGVYEEGNGSSNDPFEINNLSQFRGIFLDGDNGYNYKLMSDLDLEDFTAISNVTFNGVLDGNDKTLSNLLMNVNIYEIGSINTERFVGLFSVLNGEVKDLNIYNGSLFLNSYHSDVGVLYGGIVAGFASSGSIIDNVSISNSKVEIHRDKSMYGSIVGWSKGVITNSEVINSSLVGNGHSGGIVGYLTDGGSVTFCEFKGTGLNTETNETIYSSFWYYGVVLNNTEYNNSTAGIAGIVNNATVEHCSIDYVEFLKSSGGLPTWNTGDIVGVMETGAIENSNEVGVNVLYTYE